MPAARSSTTVRSAGNPGSHIGGSIAAILLCLIVVILRPSSDAATAEPLEYQVKAAFLLNFTKFIEWPSESVNPPSAASVCILGDDPFGTALDQIVAGETLQGRRLDVQRIRRPVPTSCRVVFVGSAEKDLESIVAGLGTGVLTVGEGAGFLRHGGIIAFVIENHRVRFDVNQSAAARAHLSISSKLLGVARSVER